MTISGNYFKLFILQLLLLGIIPQYSFAQTYGLNFKGRNVASDKRTELNLTPEGFMKFQDEFEISFDYKITRITANSNDGFFGYIFRIINNEDNSIDLLSTPTPEVSLSLVICKSKNIIPINYPQEAVNNWIRLRIKFLLNDDKLIFYTPDTFYVHQNVGFNKNELLRIIFGANDYKQFKNTDVPSMTIKDVEIIEKGKLRYRWPLNEKEGVIATDQIKGKKATVFNPSWLVRNNYNWQKIYEDEINNAIAVTADTDKERIFIIGKDELTVYSLQKNNTTIIKYKKHLSFPYVNYRAIYSTIDNSIYCYLVDKVPYYKINVETGDWDEIGTSSKIRSSYIHHNSYFNASKNEIFLFGGYGYHHYENIIRRIDLVNQVWEEMPTNDSIFSPRYLAGLGSLNDTIYILGGYGSESGNQLVNPGSYYDLIGYSINDRHLFKKFEISQLDDNMVFGNSFWINKLNRNYYALVFNKLKFDNELMLIKGNLDSPKVEFVGDTIPYHFFDVRSFASLYYMPQQDKLFAYTSYTNDSTTEVAIYSIDNPPISSANTKKSKGKYFLYFYFFAATLLLFGFTIWVISHKRKVQIKSQNLGDVEKSKSLVNSNENSGKFVIEKINYNLIFFGGFQVFSKELTDITHKFSPILKELFLLILLHTFKNNKGISSEKIMEILWFDKSEKSARNNLAVSIGKLRSLLESVGSCELSKKTGYWKINLKDSQIKCDYVDFLNITNSKINLNKQYIYQLIEITRKGPFLLNVHYEWMDDFKSAVSDTIIETLVEFAKSCTIKNEPDFIIHLSDCIFNSDVINEDAMILKCKAQSCMGRHSMAKATYDKFTKEYLTMYGQEYENSFLDIIEIK